MQSIKSIIIKEWKCFVGSDRGLFFFYGILMMSWTLFLAFRAQSEDMSAPWWLIFFSVVVTANFSNTVFISERINGSLEILISSGHSRMAVLFGKIVFILIMSVVMGLFCVIAGTFIRGYFTEQNASFAVMDIVVYIAAALFNTTCAAFLSVRMGNPRLLHIANMVMLTILVIVHSIMSAFFNVPIYVLASLLLISGGIFLIAAIREFNSERILRPADL